MIRKNVINFRNVSTERWISRFKCCNILFCSTSEIKEKTNTYNSRSTNSINNTFKWSSRLKWWNFDDRICPLTHQLLYLYIFRLSFKIQVYSPREFILYLSTFSSFIHTICLSTVINKIRKSSKDFELLFIWYVSTCLLSLQMYIPKQSSL